MVTVRDAATVMLVRDRPDTGDLEVFMQRRSPDSVFSPGAYVFPGGAVDDADASTPVTGRETHETDALLARDGALRWFVAVAREAFEEAGFLLTSPGPTSDVEYALLDARLQLNAGSRSFASILRDHAMAVAADQLFVFSHWLTPIGPPRRYDTWFFIAAAPADQSGTHDNAEAVHSEWVRPAEALARWSADEIDLILPTMRTLRALARYDSVEPLLATAQRADRFARQERLAPFVVDDGSGERLALFTDDMAGARRGWRELAPRAEADLALMSEDRAAFNQGVA